MLAKDTQYPKEENCLSPTRTKREGGREKKPENGTVLGPAYIPKAQP